MTDKKAQQLHASQIQQKMQQILDKGQYKAIEEFESFDQLRNDNPVFADPEPPKKRISQTNNSPLAHEVVRMIREREGLTGDEGYFLHTKEHLQKCDVESGLHHSFPLDAPFGDKCVEMLRYLMWLAEQGDPQLFDYMGDEVIFLGPFQKQNVFGKSAYYQALKSDKLVAFHRYDEEYELVYATENMGCVIGSYIVLTSEDDALRFARRERVTGVFANHNGIPFLVHAHISHPDILSLDGEELPVTATYEMQQLLETIKNWSAQDAMTKLKNRNFLTNNYAELNGAFFAGKKKESSHRGVGMVLYFDLDNFKSINDTLGHEKGDEAIISFANSLRQVRDKFIPQGLIIRMGGDEFVMLDNTTDSVEVIGQLYRELKILMQETLLKMKPDLGFSLGFVRGAKARNADSLHDLIKIADHNMYRCKRRRKVFR